MENQGWRILVSKGRGRDGGVDGITRGVVAEYLLIRQVGGICVGGAVGGETGLVSFCWGDPGLRQLLQVY